MTWANSSQMFSHFLPLDDLQPTYLWQKLQVWGSQYENWSFSGGLWNVPVDPGTQIFGQILYFSNRW